MTTINLKDFYSWYTHDEFIEVSNEVAAELRADKLYEAAYQRRVIRNKAPLFSCFAYKAAPLFAKQLCTGANLASIVSAAAQTLVREIFPLRPLI